MRGHTLLLLCSICTLFTQSITQESKLVDTAYGPVKGYKNPETGIYEYQSIPYAKAPIGLNRYKAPEPPPVWLDPLEAIDNDIICPQPIVPGLIENKTMREDCLFINVHVPNTEAENLPVLVYIHGGGFQIGYGNMLIPKKLIVEHKIITVTFNYRLGVLGFLALGTEDVPGNAGMKDQVAALRWVKRNIASFGGNPNDVTIAGYSAGSAAVDLLILSKSAEGLFNKVIPESGASIAQWSIQSDPIENARALANHLNFTNVDNIDELENLFKTVSYESLINMPFYDRTDSIFGLSPSVERDTGNDVFLSKSPVDILKSGNYRKVPTLYGFANMEGLIRIDLFDVWKHKMNIKFSNFLPANLKFESKEQKETVAMQIKEFYFGDKPVSDDNILSYVNFFTDVFFAYSMLSTVRYHVEAGHDQIYLYEYSFVDDSTPAVPHTIVKGANHCAQTAAVFGGMPGMVDPNNTTEEFKKMSAIMRQIWGNFIKTGNPVPAESDLPAWPAVGHDWAPHMSLSNKISLQGSLMPHRMRFWDDIYSKHYYNPIPPPNSPPSHTEL